MTEKDASAGTVRRLEARWHLDGEAECRFRHVKNETERFVLHCHEYYEIFIILRGSAVHYVNGVSDPVSEGCLIFIRRDDIHDYKDYDGAFEFANLAFSENTLAMLFDYLGEGFPGQALLDAPLPPKIRLSADETKRLYLKLASLNTIPASEPQRRKLQMRVLLAEIFTVYFADIAPADAGVPLWLENAWRKMREPRNFIAGKDRLFELAGKTREHTTRCMKQNYGVTPTEYVNDLRLSYAARMLLSSNLNVTEIGYECGFQNMAWFYRAFAEKFGTTPAKYREEGEKTER